MPPSGPFVVAHADTVSPVLRDASTGQVLPLAEPPALPDGPLSEGEVLAGTVVPADEQAVTWQLAAVDERNAVTVAQVEEPPTTLARELAADLEPGELATTERAGAGEVHVLAVPADEAATTAAEIAADDATLARAARLGVARVEIRDDRDVVSVRYLP